MKLKYIRAVDEPALCYGVTVRTGDVADIPAHLAQKALSTGDWQKAGDEPVSAATAEVDLKSQLEVAQGQVAQLTKERDDHAKEITRLKRMVANLKKGK